MRLSQLFTKTKKDAPADETSKNAQLLIRAGFVSKEMAGVYSYLPLGLRVRDNIAQIVREEMNAVGGQELIMTTLQPRELWEQTDRWDDEKVDVWFKTKMANGSDLGLAPTHEEPITRIAANYVASYKDLPFAAYQIQTKFRNELRAKSGVMRGREFVMKDLYSFSRSQEEHDKIYEKIKQAYFKVYERLGLGDRTFLTFASGGMFSKYSHEFQTLTDAGEDILYLDRKKKLAVNEEVLQDDILKELGLKREDLEEVKAAEVGNIFSLGTKYSEPLGLKFIDEKNQERPVLMGCYGIGITRLVGVVAECFADEKGLVWPMNVAPAQIYLARLGEDEAVVKQADGLYGRLQSAGFSILYDDRDARAGEKFADADLMGIPFRVVVSQKTAQNQQFEMKSRVAGEAKMVTEDELLKALEVVSVK